MANTGRLPLKTKSGTLLPVQFSGSPKIASVVFSSSFAANYSVTVDMQTLGNRVYPHTIENVTPSGFIISICADTITSLVKVSWQAVAEGES